ncbi:hypothetical protein L873DRAFT_1793907 [Choiromyces venosus 120613-1]|uniref:SET domain-containing protein n=1 Tax=Choiromyces venosus 120613-1 TaxID=1336337 RepID=A0A3N4J486_9PEZI|nr:hypothetical protein L873DRAFT_1793907 [Choiromyces venosus 120613-1]
MFSPKNLVPDPSYKKCYAATEFNCSTTSPAPPYQAVSAGLWANKYIDAGSLILSEIPILQITTISPGHPKHTPASALAQVPEIFANSQNQDIPTPLHPEGLAGAQLGLGQAHLVRATIRGGNLVCESTWVLPRLVSRIKHSCLPNAVSIYSSSPPRLQIFAMRPILPDEEITISYYLPAVLISDTGERRGAIWKVFGFVCYCSRCRLEDRPHTVGIGRIRGWSGYLRDVRLWIAEGQDLGVVDGELGEGQTKKTWWRMKKWFGRRRRSESVRWDVDV